MYVLSNPMRLNGASVLAYPNLQEQLESVFPQGCYLLPSSLHEMIIIPKDRYDTERNGRDGARSESERSSP